jgi:hypothetical protein
MFDFDEVVAWIVASVLLGLLMSMKIVGKFLYFETAQIWLLLAFSLVMVFLFILGMKITAYYYNCNIKVKLLSFRRYWWEDRFKLKWAFPVWLFAPLLSFFVTLGHFIWSAILTFDFEPKQSRMQRKWYEMEERDVAKIGLSGPIASLIFAIILRIAGLGSLAVYPVWLAVLSLIPVGMGFKIFNGSRIMTVFLFVLSLFMLFLIQSVNIFALVIFCILIALFVVFLYYRAFEQGGFG